MNTRPFDSSCPASSFFSASRLPSTPTGQKPSRSRARQDRRRLQSLGVAGVAWRTFPQGVDPRHRATQCPWRAARPARRTHRRRWQERSRADRRGNQEAGPRTRLVGDNRPERHDDGPRGCADCRKSPHGLPDFGRDLATRADRVSELLQSTIDTSSSPSRAGLPMTSISVILSFTIVNRSALTNRPCGATTTPMAPSTSAGRVSRARCP
jgi:hypothetical protein